MAALQGRTPRTRPPPDNGPGRKIVYPGSLRPSFVEYISYAMTDFLQAEVSIVLPCAANWEANSAALRYVLRECGKEPVLSLLPKV